MLAQTQPQKIRVLIVDDSRLVRVAASKMFADGFDVLLAVDGADGWDIIQRDPDIQVVITDLVMPVMDGFELLKLIRTSSKKAISDLPVIVATGANNPEVAKQKAISYGATDFISKPFDAESIITRVISYAKYHQANQTLQAHTTIDDLTGLQNARGMEQQLAKELAFVTRHKSSMTVMSIEVDCFKDIFIRVGRAGAEAIIKRVAKVLTTAVRREDSIARTGVASFSILMPLAQAENSLELADRICQKVESFRATLDGKRMAITVSVGVSVFTGETPVTVNTVLDISGAALQQAASNGRSQIFQLTEEEYGIREAEREKEALSIDKLLLKIKDQRHEEVIPLLDVALYRLAPLFLLLSKEQRQLIVRA